MPGDNPDPNPSKHSWSRILYILQAVAGCFMIKITMIKAPWPLILVYDLWKIQSPCQPNAIMRSLVRYQHFLKMLKFIQIFTSCSKTMKYISYTFFYMFLMLSYQKTAKKTPEVRHAILCLIVGGKFLAQQNI